MTGRWNDPSAFRADPAATSASMPSRRQTLALVVVLLLVAGAVALASYVVRPEKARAFDLFHGSLFLTDQNSPVALDLATGKPTLQLIGAEKQVGTDDVTQLAVVPLTDRTLLLNESSGAFNMVDNGGFVVKHDGGGVPLVKRAGTTSSFGVASDNGQAYIVRTGASGGTDVYLVSQTTVESAIHATKSVRPRASTSMPDAASAAAGGAAAADGDLWLLAGRDGGTRKIRRLSVPAGSSAGADLVRSDEGSVTGAAAIGTATTGRDGSGTTVVGVASRDRIQVFVPGVARRTQTFAAPQNVDSIVPATSGQGRLAFLMHGIDGWSIVSVGADGSGLRGPTALPKVGVSAKLAPPAASNGALYAIDKDHGDMYRIGYDGTSGSASAYPVLLARTVSRPKQPTSLTRTWWRAGRGSCSTPPYTRTRWCCSPTTTPAPRCPCGKGPRCRSARRAGPRRLRRPR